MDWLEDLVNENKNEPESLLHEKEASVKINDSIVADDDILIADSRDLGISEIESLELSQKRQVVL